MQADPKGAGETCTFAMAQSAAPLRGMLPLPASRAPLGALPDASPGRTGAEDARRQAGPAAAALPAGQRAGTIVKDSGGFGFIQQDCSDEGMFVMPKGCVGFGGVIPPLGTRVLYSVVLDSKTGRPRAENVQPEVALSHPAAAAVPTAGERKGTLVKDAGRFGFIEQDNGDEHMFVLPNSCMAFGGVLPPVGSRVLYHVVSDAKTGLPRAEGVRPGQDLVVSAPASTRPAGSQANSLTAAGLGMSTPKGAQAASKPRKRGPVSTHAHNGFDMFGVPFGDKCHGAITKSGQSFGFIRQDSGEANMFVMPLACAAFGGIIPPEGTRVVYEVVTDSKSGLPRAEAVEPEDGTLAMGDLSTVMMEEEPDQTFVSHLEPPMSSEDGCTSMPVAGEVAGTIVKGGESFGFIEQDNGDPMFVMPLACSAFGGVIPPLGTRVVYHVVTDSKTGRPRAEGVRPESYGSPTEVLPPPMLGQIEAGAVECAGTIVKTGESFGFIQQDSGEDSMFVMPLACAAFGNRIPPLGTRVVYLVVPDAKTGRPRAEAVRPEPTAAAAPCCGGAGAAWPERAGTVVKDNGTFGFIEQDSGEDNMFVMPMACEAFGGKIPPLGTRVVYGVVMDSKTGRWRAEDVRPERELLAGPMVGYGLPLCFSAGRPPGAAKGGRQLGRFPARPQPYVSGPRGLGAQRLH